MPATEGVIKYQLEFKPGHPITEDLQELNVWRSILHGLKLIGQNETRYQGYAYGNLSIRSLDDPTHFIISASQTGKIPDLSPDHYSLVVQCDITSNRVMAQGLLRPSSEALTHAMIYQLDKTIQCVIHVHDPRLWQFGLSSDLPCSKSSVAYGTPDMADEVKRLADSINLKKTGILIMAGHEDGIICFGDSIQQAGQRLLQLWSSASHTHR